MTATITVVGDQSSADTDAMDAVDTDDSMAMETSGEAMTDDAMSEDAMVESDTMLVPDGDAMVADQVVSSAIVNNKLQDLTIEEGTAIEWKNDDQVGHTSTFGVPGEPGAGDLWDSGSLILNKTFTHTFSEAGEFVYFCRFHPGSMRATITVVAADASSSDADADKEMEAMESGEAMDAEPEIEPEPEPVTVTSEIRDFALQNLTIEVGTTVTWVNRDPVSHTSTSGVPGWPSGLWDSELLSADASFSHTFSETGEFEFFCIPHNSFMKATVTVVDAS